MYQERGNTAEVEQKIQASRASAGLVGSSYGGQPYANQAAPSEVRDVETLGNTVDRLNGLMHAIGSDFLANRPGVATSTMSSPPCFNISR